jgi:hypothetical protein
MSECYTFIYQLAHPSRMWLFVTATSVMGPCLVHLQIFTSASKTPCVLALPSHYKYTPSQSLTGNLHFNWVIPKYVWHLLIFLSLCSKHFHIGIPSLPNTGERTATLHSSGSKLLIQKLALSEPPEVFAYCNSFYFHLFFFFGGTAVRTQGFAFAKQELYCLSHSSSPFCSGYLLTAILEVYSQMIIRQNQVWGPPINQTHLAFAGLSSIPFQDMEISHCLNVHWDPRNHHLIQSNSILNNTDSQNSLPYFEEYHLLLCKSHYFF